MVMLDLFSVLELGRVIYQYNMRRRAVDTADGRKKYFGASQTKKWQSFVC